MTEIQKDRPVWFQRVRDLTGTWFKWFGYWAFMDLVLHLASQRLGWTMFGEPRTPGGALFYCSWMATWFMLIFSAGNRVSIFKKMFSRPTNNAQ